MAMPKGSCVILAVLPAGVTYLPLGNTDTPLVLILAYSFSPGTVRIVTGCWAINDWDRTKTKEKRKKYKKYFMANNSKMGS
jgi:hypothetical protein